MRLYKIGWPGDLPKIIDPGREVLLSSEDAEQRIAVPIEGEGPDILVMPRPSGPILFRGDKTPDDGCCLAVINSSSYYSRRHKYHIYDAKGVEELVRAEKSIAPTVLARVEPSGEFRLEDNCGIWWYRWDGSSWSMELAGRIHTLALDFYKIGWPGKQPEPVQMQWKTVGDLGFGFEEIVVGNEGKGESTVVFPIKATANGPCVRAQISKDGVELVRWYKDPSNGECLALICAGDCHDVDSTGGCEQIMRGYYPYYTKGISGGDPVVLVMLVVMKPEAKVLLEIDDKLVWYRWDGKSWEMNVIARENYEPPVKAKIFG